MKKFKAMILALSLGVVCVGNQMNLSVISNPKAPGNSPLPKPVLLVEPTAIANSGNRLFQDIIRFKLSKSNGAMSPEDIEILDCKFSSLSTFVNVISDEARKVLSATILASPLHHIVIGQVPQKEVNRMMENLINGIINNLDSVEWNIDTERYCGTVKFNMNSIPDNISVPINLFPELIKVEGNIVTLSF